MRGLIGMVPVKTVKIIPESKYPFKIEEVHAQKGKDIRFELKPLKDQEKSGYELTVENLKKAKGRYSDTIILKTDSKIKPELKIHVYGDILDKPRQKITPELKMAPRSPLTQPGPDPALVTPGKPKQAVPTTEIKPPPEKTVKPEKEAKPSASPSKKSSDKAKAAVEKTEVPVSKTKDVTAEPEKVTKSVKEVIKPTAAPSKRASDKAAVEKAEVPLPKAKDVAAESDKAMKPDKTATPSTGEKAPATD